MVNDWNIYKDIKCLVCLVCFKMSFHLDCANTNGVYVITDTHGLRVKL